MAFCRSTALILSVAVFFYGCHARPEDAVWLHARTFQSGKGWGYDIMTDEKIFIHQAIIPGRTGAQAFSTEKDAMAVAGLVVGRINAGQLPTVTEADLRGLGIGP